MRLKTASPGVGICHFHNETDVMYFGNCFTVLYFSLQIRKLLYMQKKEYYKHNLPHYQQPGQAYFVTWSLKNAVPSKALNRYANKLELLKSQIVFYEYSKERNGSESTSPIVGNRILQFKNRKKDAFFSMENQRFGIPCTRLEKIKKEFYITRKKYISAYNDLLDLDKEPRINLTKAENTKIVSATLKFWEGRKLKNYAFCIMPNHVHWVLELFEKDNKGEPVYLQDIMYSIKRFSANQINRLENRSGSLWQKESFDRTIRNEKHLYYTIEYTLNNPVNAGFVKDWKEWKGCWCREQGAADSNPLS